MKEQAGIYKLDFYENKDLNIIWEDDSIIKDISTQGEILTIENSNEETIEITMKTKIRKAFNNELTYLYEINWKLLGIGDTNAEIISKLTESIYGWVAIIEFYNKDRYIVLNPFKNRESEINNNISHHYNVVMVNELYGEKMRKYEYPSYFIFEDGARYLFEDGKTYIFD